MNAPANIQPLLWPSPDICSEESLYYRRNGKTLVTYEKKQIICESGATICFDTYFNSFPFEKWKKYTFLSTLQLQVALRGDFQLLLVGYRYRNGAVISSVLKAEIFHAEEVEDFSIEYPQQDALVCGFTLQALSDESIFAGGAYCCINEQEQPANINLALNICTYHREKFLRENLLRIKKVVQKESASDLRDHLHIYVTDNGKTFDAGEFEPDYIHLYAQNAMGSAGGFAAGEIAIQRDQSKYKLSHMIFMDDDIILDPAVLVRTLWFLRFLRPEYKKYVLGSGLLRLHHPTVQVEAGARWINGRVISTKPNLDLRLLDHVLVNELEVGCNYQGWWFCCVPIANQGFPCPLYFHRDDIEFGLRQPGFIHLNGICVWHEEFENKPFSQNEYYDARNNLIVNCIHCPQYGRAMAVKDLIKSVLKKIAIYRYRDAKLILKGVQDFCNGPTWILKNDSGQFYNLIVSQGYVPASVSNCYPDFKIDEYEHSLQAKTQGGKTKKVLRYILGFILPAKRTIIVPAYLPSTECFYRAKKAVHYNADTGMAYVTEKSALETFCGVWMLLKTSLQVVWSFKRVAQEWRERIPYFSTMEFWKKKLNFELGE